MASVDVKHHVYLLTYSLLAKVREDLETEHKAKETSDP